MSARKTAGKPRRALPAWARVLQKEPEGHSLSGLGTLFCLELSPDGRVLATGGGLGVLLWDLHERRVIGRLAAKLAPIVGIAFSPDGKRLAILGSRGEVGICDLARREIVNVRRRASEDDEPRSAEDAPRLQFDPTGERLLVMGDEQTWLVADGRLLALAGEKGPLGEGAVVAGFSGAGEVVVLGEEETSFHRVGIAGSRPRLERTRTISFHAGPGPVAVSGDGRFLLAPARERKEGTFAIVSLETGDVLATPHFRDSVYGIRFAWHAPLVFVDVYGKPVFVPFPERAEGEVASLPNEGRFKSNAVNGHIAIAPDGRFYALGDGYHGNIVFRDFDGREWFPPLGRHLYDSESAMAHVGIDARAERCVFVGHIGDGQNSSAWAQSWDLGRDAPEAFLSDDLAVFSTSVALVPGADLVALPLDRGGILLSDRKTGEGKVLEDDDSFQNVAVGRNGELIAGGSINGDLVLWDRATGKQIACVRAHFDQVCGLAWQPGGDVLASTSQDGRVRLWSATTLIDEGKPRDKSADERSRKPAKPMAEAIVGDMLYAVVFSADGALCAVGMAEGGACVIRVSDGSIVRRVEGHASEVMTLAFHPRTGHLVTGSSDGMLKVWDVETGACLVEHTYESPEADDEYAPGTGITTVAFDETGEALVIGHMNGLIRRFRLPITDPS
ncbi:WD40 repeat domain-containing protein [Polyangium sp. 15x6]|uniref:WD40 repeat domain-containing protein n=1 Tax=Polyangium sp. 15x6 TaxID=3042687 RepID=UPI00249B8237|nr:WD40 repeat domain-containing protein [Polyangium sp. 15x6]MDI3291103.1 WD40 repeat domain-containing protein [Polyangium sp. 15x6]